MNYSKQILLAVISLLSVTCVNAQIKTNEVTIEPTTKTEISGDVDITGKVGIGTSSPNDKLQVHGKIRVSIPSNTRELLLNAQAGTIDFYNSDFNINRYGSGNILMARGGGKVLIGNTATDAQLGVGGDISFNSKIGYIPHDDFDVSGNSVAHYGLSRISVSGATHMGLSGFYGLKFFSEGKERITLLKDGKVGIGTSSPLYQLEVSGDATIGKQGDSGELRFRRSSNGNPVGYIGIADTSSEFRLRISSGGSYFTFWTNGPSAGYNEKMRLDPNGNLGIGTTSPNEKLHVAGKIRATGQEGWSDFVFYENYVLPTLKEVEEQISEKGHLKDIPSEA